MPCFTTFKRLLFSSHSNAAFVNKRERSSSAIAVCPVVNDMGVPSHFPFSVATGGARCPLLSVYTIVYMTSRACGKLGQTPPALPLGLAALSSRHAHATLANHHAFHAAISRRAARAASGFGSRGAAREIAQGGAGVEGAIAVQ